MIATGLKHIRRTASAGIERLDRLTTRVQLGAGIEQPGLVTLLFHHVFADQREIDRNLVYPQEAITYDGYREIIEYFLAAGYDFITPEHKKLIMLTFDDGYYNNLRILPLLREYQTPISIFLATHYIVNGRAYWWDVVHRHRVAAGASEDAIWAEQQPLMTMTREGIDNYLRSNFGAEALKPVSDLDRPLTPAEVTEVAREPLVYLGNHTSTHANLGALNEQRMVSQLKGRQADLVTLTGRAPHTLSYPYGAYNTTALRAAAQVGFKLAITCLPVKTRGLLPPGSPRALQIGRNKIYGTRALIPQCAYVRSDVSVRKTLQRRRVHKAF